MKEHLGEMKPVSFLKEKRREELTQIEGNTCSPDMSYVGTCDRTGTTSVRFECSRTQNKANDQEQDGQR